MLEFRIGGRVRFHPEGRPSVTGMVTRYNRKTVSIVTDDGQRWNVSPQLLERAEIDAHTGTPEGGNVIALPLPEGRRR
jgi:hypothetical protein